MFASLKKFCHWLCGLSHYKVDEHDFPTSLNNEFNEFDEFNEFNDVIEKDCCKEVDACCKDDCDDEKFCKNGKCYETGQNECDEKECCGNVDCEQQLNKKDVFTQVSEEVLEFLDGRNSAEQTQKNNDKDASEIKQHPYINMDTFKVSINCNDESYQNKTKEFKQAYELFLSQGQTKVSVGELLDELEDNGCDFKDACHFIFEFEDYNKNQFAIPFSLEHINDMFPMMLFEDLNNLQKPFEIFLTHEKNGEGICDEDFTDKLLKYAWNEFSVGFSRFRNHAWDFLTCLTPDTKAVITSRVKIHDQLTKEVIISFNNGNFKQICAYI